MLVPLSCLLKHRLLTNCSVSPLLRPRWNFLHIYDLQSLAASRAVKSTGVYLNLLDSRIGVSHVGQGVWNRRQAYRCWRQPVHLRFDLCLLVGSGCHDPYSNELSEQGDG